MTDRDYVLTEEVARQTLEVVFDDQPAKWFVCFSNPTAGPWKLIWLYTPGGPREVSPYLKEDVRPDVVLQSFEEKILIYLEAKKDVGQLLGETQLEKSARMFAAEQERFRRHLSKFEPGIQYLHLNGFIFPSTQPEADLAALHKSLVQEGSFAGDHYVVFLVVRERSKDLKILWHIERIRGDIGSIHRRLESSLPDKIAPYHPD